jgi:hypothetical protein
MARLRDWIDRMLGDGEPETVDPDTIVDAAIVPYAETAVVVAELERAGLRASAADWRAAAGEGPVTHSRIICRAGDVDAVCRVIDDVTSTR